MSYTKVVTKKLCVDCNGGYVAHTNHSKRCGKCRKLEHHRYQKEWRDANPEKSKAIVKRKQLKLRRMVLSAYGGDNPTCRCCGEKEQKFLNVDHVNGGGNKHRRSIKRASIYRWLKINNYPTGFQLLCSNCNQAKYIYGKCPHKDK